MITARRLALGAGVVLAGMAAGCIGPASRGSFESNFTVSGPAHLYLTNGSGSTRITAGTSGQVQIHGDFRVRTLPWEDSRRRAEDISRHPPVRQEGSLIRVGFERFHGGDVSVDYVIQVPPETEVRVADGSGDVSVSGVAGPVTLASGSGDVTLSQIQGGVHSTSGSGNVHADGIKGSAEITAGSGDITLNTIGGVVRVTTGSGNITVSSPGDTVSLRNGSGDIRVTGASSDLRVHTGSGTVRVAGSPAMGAYWELRAGSGDVGLTVPSTATFRFYAQTHMGDIQSSVPMTIIEKTKRELRGVVGQGSARVEVETGSGDIRLESSRP